MTKKRIAVFASGTGTNAEEFFKKYRDHPDFEIQALFCNKPGAKVLDRARNYNVKSILFSKEDIKNGKVTELLKENKIDFIVLAGYLWLIPSDIVKVFKERIINIHPALLPKFGGKGMYGMKVHESVIKYNEDKSGITIHYVNENYDEGSIIFQASVKVEPSDTPESLASKIHQLEHKYYPDIVEQVLFETFQ